MYLLALKSAYAQIGFGRVVVLNDGSLTPRDLSTLADHVPAVEIVHISSVKLSDCPKGGTWERLLLISDLVKEQYVIQLDSDSLTLNPIPDVMDCIARNCSFTMLGRGSLASIEPVKSTCERARSRSQTSTEPQAISERSFDLLPDSESVRYVRGTSAFAGFAAQSFTREQVRTFSLNMQAICGHDKWREWGSEQVTSNLIIANSPQAQPLAFPKYVSYYPSDTIRYEDSSFVHFMGTHRFENGLYSKLARELIKAWSTKGVDGHSTEWMQRGRSAT